MDPPIFVWISYTSIVFFLERFAVYGTKSFYAAYS